ncbi:sensor domain-containing diguanylate cyclase [Clostridiaceae bacterium 35-E11]
MPKKSKNQVIFFILLTALSPFLIYYIFYSLEMNPVLPPAIISFIVLVMLSYLFRIFNKETTLHLQQIEKFKNINRELIKYNEIKEVMLQISNSIVNIKNMDELLQLTVDAAVQIIDHADTASILIKNDNDIFEFKATHGFDILNFSQTALTLEEVFIDDHELSKYCHAKIIHNPKCFNDINMSDKNYQLLKKSNALNIKSTICTSIVIDDQIYGFINVDSLYQQNIFKEEDKIVMEYLASQLAIAIKNVLLFEKTLFLSRYDGLTKVYHRHYFDELFENLYKRAKRYHENFCLCIMDLNNLKQINDIYGHLAGDMAIAHFAKILRDNVRESDLLGRYGGDEFIAVFLNTDYKNTEKKMRKIYKLLSKTPLHIHEHSFVINFSFGIASFPNDTLDDKELIKIADFKMYKNKSFHKTM